ncbi:hypothetical protein [Roseobacter sp. HKCCD7870]|uniref:hypothetical protein n=1 Tax=Roseobacter sp. HKCCD7870 TaxID=3120343 RepID=UPI0030EB9D4D
MIELMAEGISLRFDPRIGQIVDFTVTDGGQSISPLHKAPWVDSEEEFPDGVPPHLKTLGGDFFCAPFGQETEDMPLHGWPANSEWLIDFQTMNRLCARLKKSVNGAKLTKEIELRDGHPFVYQRHTFTGLTLDVPFSNHANVSLPNGGIISTSRKREWRTPYWPVEIDPIRGRSGLSYPGQSFDPRNFPALKGTADLTHYPWFPCHEDFVVGIEAYDHELGWTAVTRPVEGDLFLSLRATKAMPMTMLWHSNGGRDYAPWSGRHFGCLGVEEGWAPHILGRDFGVNAPFSGSQGSIFSVCHVIGAVSWPSQEAVDTISLSNSKLAVKGELGALNTVALSTERLMKEVDAGA